MSRTGPRWIFEADAGASVARSKSKRTRGTGIEDDIFLHLLDAWVESHMTGGMPDKKGR